MAVFLSESVLVDVLSGLDYVQQARLDTRQIVGVDLAHPGGCLAQKFLGLVAELTAQVVTDKRYRIRRLGRACKNHRRCACQQKRHALARTQEVLLDTSLRRDVLAGATITLERALGIEHLFAAETEIGGGAIMQHAAVDEVAVGFTPSELLAVRCPAGGGRDITRDLPARLAETILVLQLRHTEKPIR